MTFLYQITYFFSGIRTLSSTFVLLSFFFSLGFYYCVFVLFLRFLCVFVLALLKALVLLRQHLNTFNYTIINRGGEGARKNSVS
jgi:hypothetical protein